MRFVAIALFVLGTSIAQCNAIFKLTKVECLVMEKKIANFTECRLKAVRRNVAEFTMRLHLMQRFVKSPTYMRVLRKYNTYKPFILDGHFDLCDYMKHRRFAKGLDILFNLIGDYTNLNHTCPLEGEIVLNRFYPKHSNMLIPLPTGEYLFKSDWFVKKKLGFSVNVWFSFREEQPWEKKE